MAEEENTQPVDGEETEKKPGGKKKLLIIIILLLVVAGGGAGAYFGGFIGGGGEKETVAEGEHAEDHDEESGEGAENKEESSLPFFYDLQEFIVNLNVGSQSPSFLKMIVTLELDDALDVPKLEVHLPRIRDSFHIYIRELRKSDLRGSEGVYRLREELLLRVNKIAHPTKIRDVLFKEILIQ